MMRKDTLCILRLYESRVHILGHREHRIDMKRIVNRKLNIGIADGRVFVDGKEIYFAKGLRVCLVAEADDEYGYSQTQTPDADSPAECGEVRTASLA